MGEESKKRDFHEPYAYVEWVDMIMKIWRDPEQSSEGMLTAIYEAVVREDVICPWRRPEPDKDKKGLSCEELECCPGWNICPVYYHDESNEWNEVEVWKWGICTILGVAPEVLDKIIIPRFIDGLALAAKIGLAEEESCETNGT